MLILKPQINLETKVIEVQKDYVVLACSVIATHSNGFTETLETFYQTVTKEQFNKIKLTKSEHTICLPGLIVSPYFETITKIYFDKRFSPYKTFDFQFSQPIRGPNII